MEENKLFDQIKSAAENAETKDFPGMEKVWNRVEEKLDNKEDKKAIWRWKKIAVAASLLLFGTLGYQFFKNNPNTITEDKPITTIDTIKKTNPNTVASAEPLDDVKLNPAIKKNAEQILNRQIKPASQVALGEKTKPGEPISNGSYSVNQSQMGYFTAPTVAKTEALTTDDYKFETKKVKTSDLEVFVDADKNTKKQPPLKEEPLVIVDDKVSKKDLKDHEFTEGDSLIVLTEPLYIINGVEYTEQEVFGPNPTSPYTPLNKQEIETLSILQDQKAIDIYGKKGSKGVVIITTKNGKPVTASKKAK